MPTLNETMRAVRANPEAYKDAFPVAEPPVVLTCEGDLRRVWRELEAFWETDSRFLRDLGGPNLTATGATIMAQNSLHQDSVSQRILDDARARLDQNHRELSELRRRGSWEAQPGEPIWSTYPDLNAPVANGEPVFQAHCYLCNADKLCVTRTVNEEGQGFPFNTSVCSDCLSTRFYNSYNRLPAGRPFPAFDPDNHALRTHDSCMEWRAYGEGLTVLDEAGQVMSAVVDRMSEMILGGPARPDHYRVHPGQCACGFKSVWANDMNMHLDDAITDTGDGVPKRWKLCECGESQLCREVIVARPPRLTFSTPTVGEMPLPQVDDRVYLCDDCCARRGIGG